MKQLFALLLGSAVLTSLHAQDIGGCTSYFADNYDPIATYNDSTCVYDLQQLLVEGTSIGDLLFSGVLESELIGLFAEGGVVIDIDAENDRALVAAAYSGNIFYQFSSPCSNNESATGSLLAEELESNFFPSNLYEGPNNWRVILNSYQSRFGFYSSSSGFSYSAPFASIFWGRINQIAGYTDWFVPNSSEFKRYLEVVEAVGSASIDWPVDANGEITETRVIPAYDFNDDNHGYLLSEILNAGAASEVVEGSIQYVYPEFRMARQYYSNVTNENPQPLFGIWNTIKMNGNAANYYVCTSVLPMRVAKLNFGRSPILCPHWDYGGSENQAVEAGVTCSYPLFQCDSVTSDVWDELVIGIYPANTSVVEYGRSDTRDILLNTPSTHEIDGNIYDVIGFEVNSVSNVPTGLTINIEASDVVDGGEVHCIEFAEYALEEGVFDLDISGTLYMDILGSTLTTDITLEHRIAVTANVNGVEGCIYPTADNYNALATDDDGTCLFGGICPGDFNNDGIIGIMDILHLLGIYDTTCE